MIRKAEDSDHKAIAKLMMAAMKEVISKMTGNPDPYSELPFLEHFIQKEDNQYSFQNTLVYEDNHEIIGSITVYDGSNLEQLRQPVLDYLDKQGKETSQIDAETEGGEFYIDTISVAEDKQGRGIGAELLKAAISWGKEKGHSKIGLLVDPDNPNAQRLYQRMGFTQVGKRQFMGIGYRHMVYNTR